VLQFSQETGEPEGFGMDGFDWPQRCHSAAAAGHSGGRRLELWWPGAGSNRRPTAFQLTRAGPLEFVDLHGTQIRWDSCAG